MKRRLLRLAISVSARVRQWRVVRRTGLGDAIRSIGRRLQPWMARTAFVDEIHEVNGVQMRIPRPQDSAAGSSEFHMALGTYEKQELEYVVSHLSPGDTFLDVGAHVGYFTLPAAKAVGSGGQVIAIEPSPASVAVLRANTELNGLSWIKVFEVGASDDNGPGLLVRSPKSAMWNSLVRRAQPAGVKDGRDTVAVSKLTIDTILAECDWPPIAGIKIDVEGGELDVLRGSTECLDRNPQAFVLIEMGIGWRLKRSLAVLHLLEDQGYVFRQFRQGAAPTEQTVSSIASALETGSMFNVVAERPTG